MKKALFVLCVDVFVMLAVVIRGHAYLPVEESIMLGEDEANLADVGDQWIASFGGTSNDEFVSIAETIDGGFIVAGTTHSFGAGEGDIWVLNFNQDGSINWQKTYGGGGEDTPLYIGQTDDGGFFIVGETASFLTYGYWNIWILRLTSTGDFVWQKTCCATDARPTAAQLAQNGELMVGGYSTLSFSQWLMRLQADGTMVWQKILPNLGSLDAIQETSDGGFIVVGGYLVRFAPNGEMLWQKNFWDIGLTTAQQINDGGFIVSGFFFEGGGVALWEARLTSDGTIVWQKALNTSDNFGDEVIRVIQTSDEGFITLVQQDYNQSSSMLLKLDASGNVLWQKTYEGFQLNDVMTTNEGDLLAVGRYPQTSSAANTNAAILKLDDEGNVSPCGWLGASTPTITDTHVISNTLLPTSEPVTLIVTDTTSMSTITGVVPNAICEAGRQLPKIIPTIFTTAGLPNVILVSQTDSSSNIPILPQYTMNGGQTWQPLAENALSYYPIGIVPRDDPQNPVRLFSAYPPAPWSLELSLFRSGDWGQTWASGFLNSSSVVYAFSPKNPQHMYWSLVWSTPCFPGCEGGPYLNAEFYESTDGGVSWTLFYSSVGYESINQIVPSPVNEADGFFEIDSTFGGGQWWLRFGNNDPLTFPVDLIALDAVDANRIYGVTYDFSSGQTSPDGGITWIPWAASPPLACVQLMAHPIKNNTLYLRCAAGLFRSTNGGDNWSQITSVQGDALAPHLGNSGQILWSHDGCLLASDDDGDSWTIMNCFNTFPYDIFLPILRR